MKNLSMFQTLSFSLFIGFLILTVSTITTTAQEVENEREFNYDVNSEFGPHRWGEIHPDWSLCNNGTMQSPIDLLNDRVEVVSHLGILQREYKPANATLVNRGHDISLQWMGDAGHIEINGTKYDLKQCHWHSPSEHTLDGKSFDLEVHLVHQTKTNDAAVIGIMYKIERADSFLSMLEEHLIAIANKKEEKRAVGIVDPRQIKIGSEKYYRYIGSLTIPPCTQNVVWTIIGNGYENNARPSQPINSRDIELYIPQKNKD